MLALVLLFTAMPGTRAGSPDIRGSHPGCDHSHTGITATTAHGTPSDTPGAHPGHDRAHIPEALRIWRAGEKVSEEAVAEYGIDRCFASSEIGDALLARMYGKSYKPDCTGPARSSATCGGCTATSQAKPCWANWSATRP